LARKSESQSLKVQEQASKTAYGVVLTRQMYYSMNLNADYLTHVFLTRKDLLIGYLVSFIMIYTGKLLAVPGDIIPRTEMGDEIIRRFIKSNQGKQIVSLGCGFDARGYRLDILSKNKEIKYFEVDIATTQHLKLQALIKHKVKHHHVIFAPIDFSKETFSQALTSKGWKVQEPTLFLFEGVSTYLTEEAVHETLTQISKCAKGSMLFMDITEDLYSNEGKKKA